MTVKKHNIKEGVGSPAFSTAAKTIGIISLPFALFIPLLGIILAFIAIVLGATSLKTQNRDSAVTGIITGAVALFLALLMIVTPIFYTGVMERAREQSEQ